MVQVRTLSRLKIGMIGIGVGGAEILPAMEAMDTVDVVAGADIVPTTLERFSERFPDARTYASAEELCADPNVDAVWVSSPNRFHAEHTILAARSGKHVVVEKPMAVTLADAARMVEAADKVGIKLLAGHTRAFTLPIRAMRKVIESGKYGQLRALNIWSYSDWSQWMPERPIPGHYAAFMEFENGTPATISHNGYGYFLGAELVPWGEDRHRYTAAERASIRQQLRAGTRAETTEKQALRIGGDQERLIFRRDEPEPWVPEDMGMAIASLDRADLRQSRYGIYVHSDAGKEEIDVLAGRQMGVAQRRAELEELYDAVVLGKPLWHDGRWGMATLEVCLAMMESARERKEIMLQHQVPVPDGYDADLQV